MFRVFLYRGVFLFEGAFLFLLFFPSGVLYGVSYGVSYGSYKIEPEPRDPPSGRHGQGRAGDPRGGRRGLAPHGLHAAAGGASGPKDWQIPPFLFFFLVDLSFFWLWFVVVAGGGGFVYGACLKVE